MEKSSTISELAKALVAFQAEIETVGYDAANPFFRSEYATLAQLVLGSRKLATKHGLAVVQLPEDECSVVTILMHTSGEYLWGKLTLKPVKDDPQGRGGCITYSRRYCYGAILGLVTDKDDDGNKASGLSKQPAHAALHAEVDKLVEEPMDQKTYIKSIAKTKFKDPDQFNAWLVDNNLPESVEKATPQERSKIITLLREVKKQ